MKADDELAEISHARRVHRAKKREDHRVALRALFLFERALQLDPQHAEAEVKFAPDAP